MTTKRVEVCPYDPDWPAAFSRISDEAQKALGSLLLRAEHVGSTSVPGLAAKPIIDLDLVIADDADLRLVISRLADIGYRHEGDLGIRGREAFRYEGKPHLLKHHLYVCRESSRELHRHITFRDFLRNHPEAAAEYGAIKLEAARRFPDSVEQYMAFKSDCIAKLYRQCGL